MLKARAIPFENLVGRVSHARLKKPPGGLRIVLISPRGGLMGHFCIALMG